jgi:hypothetical protein
MITAEEEVVVTNQAVEGAPVSEGSAPHHCPHCGGLVIAAPALHDAEDGSLIQLHCFARRAGAGRYVAECIDLDISAEAETLQGAITGLQDAMIGYMYVVFEGQGTNAVSSVSILRPSPLGHRVRYYFEYLKSRVSEFILQTHGRTAKNFYEVSADMTRSHCGV